MCGVFDICSPPSTTARLSPYIAVALKQCSTARCEETHNDASTYENTLVVDVNVDGSEAPVEQRFKLARSKLAEALTVSSLSSSHRPVPVGLTASQELLDALRSSYPILEAVRSFLPPGQAK